MPNNTLKQIKLICRTYDIRPQRQKGQNFLINKGVIEKIISTADLSANDVVLEVGPGLGILTEALAKKVKKVISVELDKNLFNFLKAKFVNVKNLELVHNDILKLDPTSYLSRATPNSNVSESERESRDNLLPTSYKIVANLPYNITSHFLKKFLTAENRPIEMTLLIQKEVAERICASAGQMSLLAVSVQLYGQPKIIKIIKKENFWPQPKVDSAILKISNIRTEKEIGKHLEGITEEFFWQIVRIGFSAKRKQLQNNLSAGLQIPEKKKKKILNQANFDPKIRAQNLSVKDWIFLAKKIDSGLN